MRDANTNATLEQMHVRMSLSPTAAGRIEVGSDIYDLKKILDFQFQASKSLFFFFILNFNFLIFFFFFF